MLAVAGQAGLWNAFFHWELSDLLNYRHGYPDSAVHAGGARIALLCFGKWSPRLVPPRAAKTTAANTRIPENPGKAFQGEGRKLKGSPLQADQGEQFKSSATDIWKKPFKEDANQAQKKSKQKWSWGKAAVRKPCRLKLISVTFTPQLRPTLQNKGKTALEKALTAGETVGNTWAGSALGALLSISIFPKSASNSVWQRLGSFSRLVWFKKEKMGKGVLV